MAGTVIFYYVFMRPLAPADKGLVNVPLQARPSLSNWPHIQKAIFALPQSFVPSKQFTHFLCVELPPSLLNRKNLRIENLALGPFMYTTLIRVPRLGESSPNGPLLTLGSFFNKEVAQIFGLLFPWYTFCFQLWQTNGLGNILGDFITNSTDHPDPNT
jgi:hypothetical protein